MLISGTDCMGTLCWLILAGVAICNTQILSLTHTAFLQVRLLYYLGLLQFG